MSEGPGFLEFFILEASDYVEQLDGLLLGGSSTGPDAGTDCSTLRKVFPADIRILSSARKSAPFAG